MNNNMTGKSLLRSLQELEFSCVDLNQYLDTHPNDLRAMEIYQNYSRKLRDLKDCYDKEVGPLQNFGGSISNISWVYGTPWPWEKQ